MNVNDLEDRAGENASRILSHIGTGTRESLVAVVNSMSRQDLAWVAVTLAVEVTRREDECGELTVKHARLFADNEVLENANKSLFQDRRKAVDKIAELREELAAARRQATLTRKAAA